MNTIGQASEHRHALTRKQAKLRKNLANQEAQMMKQLATLIQLSHNPHD